MVRFPVSLLIICIFSLQWVSAQDGFRPFSEIGVRTSAVSSTAYISLDDEGSNFRGPSLGVRYLHMQTKNMGLLAEVNYSRLFFDSNDTEYDYSYIHTPFMTRFRFPFGSRNDLAINVGSYLQMVLDNHSDVIFDRRTLFGLAGGIDYGLMLGKLRISLEGRYHYNLHSNSDDADNIRSSWLEISLGICFRKLGKVVE